MHLMSQADEVSALVALAEARMAELLRSGAMSRDPYAMALSVLVAVTKTLAAARHPLTAAERDGLKADLVRAVADGAVVGAAREARALGRKVDRRLAVWIGCAVGLAFVLGGVTVAGLSMAFDAGRLGTSAQADAAWAQLMRDNPDPRAAMKASPLQVDSSGRRFFSGLAMWAEPGPGPQSKR